MVDVVVERTRRVVDAKRRLAAGEPDLAERHAHAMRAVDEHTRRMREVVAVVADVRVVRRDGKRRWLRGNGHLVLDFSTTRKETSGREMVPSRRAPYAGTIRIRFQGCVSTS